jgi:hypothetical protein
VGATATFPIPTSVALDNNHINVDGVDEIANECTGSVDNPTAPPGYVCIYPSIAVSATVIEGGTGVSASGAKYGFMVDWNGTVANSQTSFRGNWAYTAP